MNDGTDADLLLAQAAQYAAQRSEQTEYDVEAGLEWLQTRIHAEKEAKAALRIARRGRQRIVLLSAALSVALGGFFAVQYCKYHEDRTPVDAGIYPEPAMQTGVPGVMIVEIDGSLANDPRATQVASMLTYYFEGINDGDYAEALSALDPAGSVNPGDATQRKDFEDAVQDSEDFEISLTALRPSDAVPRAFDATVTFQSEQVSESPTPSPESPPCSAWTLVYTVTPGGLYGYQIYSATGTSEPC